jgi:FkbM family methyltransferase
MTPGRLVRKILGIVLITLFVPFAILYALPRAFNVVFLQPEYLLAMVSKAVGRDEPCPWRQLFEYPQAAGRFEKLQRDYERRVKPIAADSDLQQFDTPSRRFWIKQAGRLMDGKTLLAFVLSEEEWIMREAPNHQVRPGNVVVDVGAHIGTFGDDALRHGAAKVVMVEPDPVNAECIRRNFAAEIAAGRVVLVQEGAWSSHGILSFAAGVANSGTGSFVVPENGSKKVDIPVRPLDEILAEIGVQKVDFIKMDIEGAEREALKGARGILRRYKPRLMLDAYHRPDDSTVLPAVIREANPAYREYCAVCSPTREDPGSSKLIPYAIFFE